jgi:putative ABC transport system permease protein
MGRALLVCRLAVRDLRRRRVEAALLLLAVMAATTTLTLGLVLRDAASDPYRSTREATAGPDVVGVALGTGRLAALEELAGAPGVVDRSGPYPVTSAELRAGGRASDVQVMGRDAAPAPVDRPRLREGSWVSDGGVVVEAAFARTLGVRAGDPVTLDGRRFVVAGVAVSAAMPPYPASSCLVRVGCFRGSVSAGVELPPEVLRTPGLVWLTRADVARLTPDPEALTYVSYLRLADPAAARAFVGSRHTEPPDDLGLMPWEEILAEATELARDAQIIMLIGAWLLGLLAVASLSVLVGSRMADQTRRVGLLKAAGGTPGLVAAVLLAEYVLVAVVAAAAGLAAGALAAPLLTESSAGLLGGAGTPPTTWSTVGAVLAAALAVAVAATVVPAVRGARSSTVEALADAARPPRRVGWLVAVSARLPVPLLLALRVAARRPRRVVLGVLSIAIMVSGSYVALVLDAYLRTPLAGGYTDSQTDLLRRVLLVWTAVLLCLTAVNAVFVTWATVLDNRHASALARALGATPGEVSGALAAAQVLPALAGAVLGVFPGGYALFAAVIAITGGDRSTATLPSGRQLVTVVLGTALVVAALTALPARAAGHRPVRETLQAEHA